MPAEVDLQRLVVQMEASFVKYQREWQKALGTTDANVRQVQAKFDSMGATISNAGSKTAEGLKPLKIQTANIASQFQDIAVQLQGGASPFTVALQQGTQLSQALGSGGGLKGALSGIAAGVVSLLNPVSLATVGFIALAGVAVQYFATLIDDGKLSEEELKKQEDLIRRVADRWGDAVPALKAYVDELDRAKQQQDEQGAVEFLKKDAFKDVLAQIDAAQTEINGTVELLQMMGNEGGAAADQLNAKFGDFATKVRNGTATTADFEAILQAVTDLSNQHSIPAFATLTDLINSMAGAFANAAQKAAQYGQIGTPEVQNNRTADFVAEQARLNSLTTEQLALETEIARVKSEAEGDNVVLTEQQALDLAQQRLAAEERRAKIKADIKTGAKGEREEEREAKAVLDLIAALEFENSLIGQSAQQQEVMNALRRAGAAATDEQRARIEELVNAGFTEREQVQALQEAYSQLEDIGRSALNSLVDAMADGKIEGQELLSILGDIASQMAKMLLNNAFSTLLGGGGGGLDLSKLFQPRAAGGPVQAGRPYIVGEKRPELFVPSTNGTILPSVGGGAQKVVNNVFNYGGDRVETRGNSSGGIDVIIAAASAAAEQRVEKNMARGKYRSFGVSPGVRRT